VLAVSYDNVTKLHSFAEHRGIRFPLLSDSGSGLIRAVGVLNDAIPRTDPYFGSSYPCVFVLNEKGVILAKYFEEDPRLTRVFTNLLTHHFGAAPASRQTEVEGRQLKLIATTSHSLVTAGQRVSLTLDIDLKPKMHVYAPGVDGYIPIEWRIKQSDATSVHEVAYPHSETIRLEAIDETVPVYRGRFRLRSTITLAKDAALRHLVDRQGNFRVEGVLRYQACDDRTCYAPQELPMKWTFHYVGSD
jgi:hypothetical protein